MDKDAIAHPKVKVAKDKANASKKGGPLRLMRAALFLIKGRSPSKSASTVVVKSADKDGLWRNLVGAVRPLHELPHCTLSPPSPSPPAFSVEPIDSRMDFFHEVPQPPPSLPFGWDEVDGMSRYASAEDLTELDKQEVCCDGNVDGGDDAIDVKADEFIAKFYKQMRLDSIGHHKSMIEIA
ncbi:hypothetical protein MRB53_028990 [Persea americana]|uniref:Uncharacterized protein n=1 Tax=Persea americana TaxID=3435 RepID=A0ACC2KHA3_PERAE|nr:hypothetical protein MRB53_028990 [Persea americana]